MPFQRTANLKCAEVPSGLKLCSFVLFTALIGVILPNNTLNAQPVAGEYSEIIVGTDHHAGSPNGGCYDYEHFFSFLDPYIFGMDLFVVIDSIRGTSDSIGVWKYPVYQETPVFEGDYIEIYDGFSNSDLHYYFYADDTVYFSIRASGIPLVEGQNYDCELNSSIGLIYDGCSQAYRYWYSGATDCSIIDGLVSVTNTECVSATELEPGMNWIYNQGVSENADLNLACWNNGEGGIPEKGVWYSFSTPDVPVEIQLQASSSNCDTVELSGVQMALFDSCNSDPLYCSSSGEGSFGQLEFTCGELASNTTYYILVDSYNGQEGIANLSLQILSNCQDLGCTDPTACNFDPEAEIDNGECLYGSDCDPEFTITVDTLDCLTYNLFAEPVLPGSYSLWFINGVQYQPDWSTWYQFQASAPGTYEICHHGVIGSIFASTCIELSIDSACFVEPCSNEIVLNSDSTGCQLTLELFPTPPSNATYNWTFGNSFESTEGPETIAQFQDDGVYEVCVEVSSANCNNIQICDSIVVVNCPITSPIEGCTDPFACNYDPEASVNDGTCLYENDCISDFEFIIDTVSCSNFDIQVSPYQLFHPGVWQLNGIEIGNFETLDLNVDTAGVYELCYSGILLGLSETTTCFQISVDPTCFSPCFNEVLVETDSSGCVVDFQIPPPIPANAQIGWQFGEGAPMIWNDLPYASNTYENDGNYTAAVLMNSLSCENQIVIIPLEISCSLDDILGCTDLNALNFDPDANTDDGSCIYDSNCLISFQIMPDSTDPGALIIIPSFDPIEALEISWSFGDGSVSSEPYPSHDYPDEGPYTLCCSATFITSDSLDCTSEYCTDVSGFLTENGGGPFSLKPPESSIMATSQLGRIESHMRVWPNPITEGILQFRLDNDHSEIVSVKIYSSDGSEIPNSVYNPNGSLRSGSISTEYLAEGVYILVCKTERAIYRSSFIIL